MNTCLQSAQYERISETKTLEVSRRIEYCEISGSNGDEYEDESLLGEWAHSLGVYQRFRCVY
jgi:hypothetical protein